jgi:hypothetical protein
MKKRGQVWVETALYTLIALVLIGLVLSFVIPKIEEVQDRTIIGQSMNLINDLNGIILETSNIAGNKRIIDIKIKKGILKIDGVNDAIIFEMKSDYQYSEYDENVEMGDIVSRTEKQGSLNVVTLKSDLSLYNITYDGRDELKDISQSSSSYRLSIENKGGIDKTVIDIVVS